MNTKTICKQLNISSKALRIYEDLDIVVPKRDKNNYRNYSEDNILKLRQIILLKDMGIPLKNIKLLLDKEVQEDNKIIRALHLQLKAVDNKINELQNIKITLEQNINDALISPQEIDYSEYFDKIDKCLSENKKNRVNWLDKWNFDSWSKNYDSSVENGSAGSELGLFEKYDYILDRVSKIISDANAREIIDFGCGTGNLYGKLKNNVEFVGIDQSIEMLLIAKSKHENIELRLGNFLDEPFVENEFDIVVSTFAFHHLNSIEKGKATNILVRYLKPHGKIVIADLMFLNEEERLKQKEGFIENGKKNLWNIIEEEYYTNIQEIKKYAKMLGCKVKFEHVVNFTWILEIIKL